MTVIKYMQYGIVAIGVLAGLQTASKVQAATCNDIAATYTKASPASNVSTPVAMYISLNQGDEISAVSTFNVAVADIKYTLQLEKSGGSPTVYFPSQLFNTTGQQTVSGTVTIPETGEYILLIHPQTSGGGSMTDLTTQIFCGGPGSSSEILNGVSTQVNQIGQKSVNQMVGGRIRQIQRTSNISSSPETVTTSGLSHQLNQQNGKNAGAPEYASGVWGNIALTHFGDHHRPTNMNGLQGTGVFGIDTRVMDNLVIGGAVNLEYASIDLGANDGEITSTAFGISPYVSWQIDDIFSLTGLANVSHIHSRLAEQRIAGTISETDMNGVRWNVAVNGDGFFTWDNWSLLTGIQLSYGQLWNFSTKNNAGIRVAGSDAKNGSAIFQIQPAYYWQYSRHLGLEPYLLAEYQYDFTMEKVTTAAGSPFHSNDEDQFRLGAGLNIFGGAFYSGNVEASAIVGREDYTEATISSNIRINF